jgi:enoyl-CoA hydratase/carnithine racemase
MGGGLGCWMRQLDHSVFSPWRRFKLGQFPFDLRRSAADAARRPRELPVQLLARLSAEDATQLGLLNRALPPAELDAAVKSAVDDIKAGSPLAIELGLCAMHEVDGLSFDEKLPALAQRLVECLATEDAREGVTAFLEKRAQLEGAWMRGV